MDLRVALSFNESLFSKDSLHLVTLCFKDYVLLLCLNNISLILVTKSWADVVRTELETQVDWESAQSNNKAPGPLDWSQTVNMDTDSSSEELGYENLNDGNDNPDDAERWVTQDSLEDIEFVINLSWADHVEDLHEHEEVEDNGKMSWWGILLEGLVHWLLLNVLNHTFKKVEVLLVPLSSELTQVFVILSNEFIVNLVELELLWGRSAIWKDDISGISLWLCPWSTELFFDEAGATEEDNKDDNRLEDSLSKDMLNHSLGDDIFLLPVWWSLEELWLWWLSGESQGGKGVHDKVDPKKLDGSKWGFLEDQGSNQAGEEGNTVDRKLELEETSNVVIDISTPRAGLDDGSKVIILDDDIGCSMSNLGSWVHGKTNIGLSESWSIIGTITSDSNDIA